MRIMATVRKRANGDGSVYQRNRGDWVASVTMPGGRRWTKSAATEDAAYAALAVLQTKLRNDVAPGDDRMRLAAYLQLWLTQKRRIGPTTRETYGKAIARIASVLGNVALGRLSPAHIRQLHRALEGADPPYAGGTMNLTHTIFSMALSDAVKTGVLTRNVALLVSKPAPGNAPEMHPLDGEQAAAFLAAARSHRFEALFVLAVTTGMRLGELLGLRWADIDLELRTLRVVGSSKRIAGKGIEIGATKRPWSRRLIPLPDIAVDALRRRKVASNEEKLRAAAYSDLGLVFATRNGTPTAHHDIQHRWLGDVLRAAGLMTTDAAGNEHAPITFHELRHTAATLLLLDGVPAKVVADLLGHSSVTITLDRYSHVLPGLRAAASEAMNRRFSGPVADSVAVSPPETG